MELFFLKLFATLKLRHPITYCKRGRSQTFGNNVTYVRWLKKKVNLKFHKANKTISYWLRQTDFMDSK